MITIFGCNQCGYFWNESPDSFCPCCDNSNIYEVDKPQNPEFYGQEWQID